jgi:sugar transferase EpsL
MNLKKRVFDLTVAVLVLPFALVLIALASLVVFCLMGWPIFFVQERSGLGGKPFKLIKLRSMKTTIGSDADRLTGFGKVLRATSIDELPSIINVLRGDMSIVGPRPMLPMYMSHYDEYQLRRFEVAPGITGLAQVSGRNLLSWEEKFDLDVSYVERQSLLLDLTIIVRTVFIVLSGHGIAASGHPTMPFFKGKKR